MIAYTAWDSLQALAQQYDADLVVAPGERLGLRKRRNHSVPRVGVHGIGERLRAGLSLLRTSSGRGVSEQPIG